MSDTDEIVLSNAPGTRSTGVLTLLEELQLPYALHPLNFRTGEQRSAEYLAINPLGKVPAILHRGMTVTEQVAIFLYLADLFPAGGLAPPIADPRRGPYLRWLVYYAASYEPAVMDQAMKREPGPPLMSPYGDFDSVISSVAGRLDGQTYLLGEMICAADILWGTALSWGFRFGFVRRSPKSSAIATASWRGARRSGLRPSTRSFPSGLQRPPPDRQKGGAGRCLRAPCSRRNAAPVLGRTQAR